jgi:hypothetical protein
MPRLDAASIHALGQVCAYRAEAVPRALGSGYAAGGKNRRRVVMRCVARIYAIVGFGLLAASLWGSPASAGLAELISPANRVATAATSRQLADRNDPRCRKCDRALDRCNAHPPYGNDRICASDYYDCIRRAHVKCD